MLSALAKWTYVNWIAANYRMKTDKSNLISFFMSRLTLPMVDLPSGVNLYYESHVYGEPWVMTPSIDGVFRGSMEALSGFAVIAVIESEPSHPRGCGRSIIIALMPCLTLRREK